MELSQEAKAICDALDEFRLPRAIVHVEQDCFIAWNTSFEERTGYSADELQVAHLKDLIVIGEPDTQFAESRISDGPSRKGYRRNLSVSADCGVAHALRDRV